MEEALRGRGRGRWFLGGLAGLFLTVSLVLVSLAVQVAGTRMKEDLLQQVLWLAAAVGYRAANLSRAKPFLTRTLILSA